MFWEDDHFCVKSWHWLLIPIAYSEIQGTMLRTGRWFQKTVGQFFRTARRKSHVSNYDIKISCWISKFKVNTKQQNSLDIKYQSWMSKIKIQKPMLNIKIQCQTPELNVRYFPPLTSIISFIFNAWYQNLMPNLKIQPSEANVQYQNSMSNTRLNVRFCPLVLHNQLHFHMCAVYGVNWNSLDLLWNLSIMI